MTDLAWIEEAKKHIGTSEIPGTKHELKILQWWKAIRRSGIKDDETPWCAAFVGGCLEAVGIRSSRFESARSYLTWGVAVSEPTYGCIVILSRTGGRHVGFLVGVTANGGLMILGGNQGNKVSIMAFDPARVLGYRLPSAVPHYTLPLPIFDGGIVISRNEA